MQNHSSQTKVFSNSTILDTLTGQKPAHPPVWIMRQAGRYLPEYRRARAQFPSFLDFCRNPEKVAEVTVQPVDRLNVDAAILFSDILVLLPPMGLELDYLEKKGPVIANPLRSQEAIDYLPGANLNDELAYVFEGIKQTKQALAGRVPLIGFAGGPFTVASYMVEGGTSKELSRLKALLFTNPILFEKLLGKLASITIDYLLGQIESGVDLITIMDSWAGYLSPEDYRKHVFSHTLKIVQAIHHKAPGTPVIHYANGAPSLLGDFVALDCRVIGLDWRTDLAGAFKSFPRQIFQGNLDPCFLYSHPDQIRSKVAEMKAVIGSRSHIFNLGHGILPDIPVEHAQAFVAAVHEE